jgi:ribose 5-phosphate isomerase B
MYNIIIGSDRVGYELKKLVFGRLSDSGYNVHDIGPFEAKSVHYPMIAMRLAQEIVKNMNTIGILVCSTGVGMSIAVNKVRGIRAANCTSTYLAEHSRAHNDANVLCLGSSVITPADAFAIIEVFISTPFEGGKHAIRVAMLNEEGSELSRSHLINRVLI